MTELRDELSADELHGLLALLVQPSRVGRTAEQTSADRGTVAYAIAGDLMRRGLIAPFGAGRVWLTLSGIQTAIDHLDHRRDTAA